MAIQEKAQHWDAIPNILAGMRTLALALAIMALWPGLPSSAEESVWAVPAHPSPAGCEAPGVPAMEPASFPRLNRMVTTRRSMRILAIGSSSTFGVGASSPDMAYPAQLEAMLRRAMPDLYVEVLNAGVSGEVAAITAARMRGAVESFHPAMILWQVGTNDALTQVPEKDFAATLHTTLGWLRSISQDVVLVGMQWTKKLSDNGHYTEIKDALNRVAAEEHIPLVSRYEAMRAIVEKRGREDLLSADGFHLNDQGYRCMAEQVAQLILDNLGTRGNAPIVREGAVPRSDNGRRLQ